MNKKTTQLLIASAISMVLVSPSAQAKKVWEMDDTFRRQVGDVHLSMQKNFSRNAEPGAFWANAINTKTGVSGIFRGVCAQVLVAKFQAKDARKINLAPFLQTRSGNNLPVEDVLGVLQSALAEQCEQLQVMRIVFNVGHHSTEDYSYEGTLSKANGWRLEDGKVATEYDRSYVFELYYRDVFSVGGVHYKGPCEKQPILELAPQYQNNSEKALSELPDMGEYHFIATKVSTGYVQNCPDVTQIRYALNPMPDEYICREKGDCFLEASLDQEWKVSTENFKQKEYNNPIYDVADVFEVLAAGRFDILEDYRSFFGFYFETYFGAYSDMCQSHIKNPVGRKIQSIERTYDSGGFLIKEDFGPIRKIFIEQEFANDFDRYFGSSRAWATAHMINSIVTSQKRGKGPIESVYRAVGFFTGNVNKMEDVVRNTCASDRLLTAQHNMMEFANFRPALTGKYTTNKKPQNKFPKNGSSAPQFSKTYHLEKDKAAQVIRDHHNKENAAKNAEKQKKIRAEIAARNAPRRAAPKPSAATGRQNGQTATPAQQMATFQAAQAQLAAISQAHAAELGKAMQEFQAKLKLATSNEERLAIQQEFQKFQQEKQQTMQKKIQELLTQ